MVGLCRVEDVIGETGWYRHLVATVRVWERIVGVARVRLRKAALGSVVEGMKVDLCRIEDLVYE